MSSHRSIGNTFHVTTVTDGTNGAKGDKGDDGNGYKLLLNRSGLYTDAKWNTYAALGNAQTYAKRTGDPNLPTCRVNDLFVVSGTSSDTGINHTATYRCTVVSANSITGVCISHVKDGLQGARGKIGRFFYYAGVWTGNSTVYVVSDAEAPYFKYGNNYWVFNPASNGSYTQAGMGTPSSSSANWEIMTNDFKYIITEAIFGSFAHFGSFIISEDWLICENGTINGQAYTAGDNYGSYPAYMFFDPQYPMGTRNLGINNVSVTGTTATQKGSSFALKGKRVIKVTGKVTSGTMYICPYFSGGGPLSSTKSITSTSSQSVTFDIVVDAEISVSIKAYMSSSSSSVVGTILSATVESFAPTFAVDGLSGKSIQNNSTVRGAIVANLMYSPTKKLTTQYYTISPNTDPYSFFVAGRSGGLSSGGTTATLPNALDYDGLELRFMTPPYSSISTSIPYIILKYEAGDGIAYMVSGVDAWRYSHYMYCGNGIVTLKAIQGIWYVIDGHVEAF